MKSKVVLAGVLCLFVVCLMGCGNYQYQAKFDLGKPIDQRTAVKAIDNGKVSYVTANPATLDLAGVGDVRFAQRSFVAGGAVTNPERQVKYWEKRTVTEKVYGDKRGCPDKSQIKSVETGTTGRTEVFEYAKTLPEESVPVSVYGAADDGPGLKALLEAERAAGNAGAMAMGGYFFKEGMRARRPDNTVLNSTQNVAGDGPVTATGVNNPVNNNNPVNINNPVNNNNPFIAPAFTNNNNPSIAPVFNNTPSIAPVFNDAGGGGGSITNILDQSGNKGIRFGGIFNY